jgi:cysteine desulfurase
MLYLDHAATTVVRPEAHDATAALASDGYGNPSGLHAVSRRAKNAVEAARERAAELLGASHPLEIVFTGGGTEADNLAVAGRALASGRRGGVVTTATEHDAVLQTASFLAGLGCPVAIVPVDGVGRIDAGAVAAAVDADTAVVSVMTANNETGVLHPVRTVVDAVRDTVQGVPFHTDAVQAFIAEPVTVDGLGADLISLAAHKFGGPKGVGLLYVRNGIELEPVLHGGGQELGRRSGTLNVAGIVGMVAAMEATVADRDGFRTRVSAARDGFEAQLRTHISDLGVNAPIDARLPQHSHVRIPGVEAETLLIRLDQEGIAAAAGSACHSGAIDISHVLGAMGMTPEHASECVRFSFGWVTEPDDGPFAADIVGKIVEELR